MTASAVATGPSWEVHCADVLAWFEAYDGPPFDALITDPPYSSGGATRGDRAQNTISKYVQTDSSHRLTLPQFEGDNRDQRSFIAWSAIWLMSAWRCCRPGATAHVFVDWRQLPALTDAVQAGGWVWRGIIPWDKTLATRPQRGRHRAQCEYILFCTRGPHQAHEGAECLPGFYQVRAPQQRYHITEKPVELIRQIVHTTPEGGRVLDPFAGSGAHLEGVVLEGRHAVGLELVPELAELAAERLRALDRGLSLADSRAGQTSILDTLGGEGAP